MIEQEKNIENQTGREIKSKDIKVENRKSKKKKVDN